MLSEVKQLELSADTAKQHPSTVVKYYFLVTKQHLSTVVKYYYLVTIQHWLLSKCRRLAIVNGIVSVV